MSRHTMKMFLQRMTDSMNRLVDFLTVPQKGNLQSGMLDANKVYSRQSLPQLISDQGNGRCAFPQHAWSFLIRLHVSHMQSAVRVN